jgi:hypothetical protein
MKSRRSVLFVLAVLLIATAVQAQGTKVHATIPFDFVVGDRAYPAGEYFLRPMDRNSTIIQIENEGEITAGLVLSNVCTSTVPSAKTKLVFRRSGENYFLYQVWVEGHASGREFPRSRTEMRLAQNHEKSELVIVAANISR